MIMTLGDFFSVLKLNITSNAEYGVYLMMYECVAIYLAVVIATRKYKVTMAELTHLEYTSKSGFTIWGLLAFLAICIVIKPDLTNQFMSIFQLDQAEFTQGGRVELNQVGSFTRILTTLFTFVFLTIRIVLPVYIIGWLIKKRIREGLIIVSILLFVFLEFMFITATFAESIISALIVILSIGKFEKHLLVKMLKIAPIFVIGIIALYFYIRHQANSVAGVVTKYDGDSFWGNMSGLINAYFTGIDNVAATFNLNRANSFSHFWSSMQVTIPFNTTLFGKAGEILPAYFNLANFEIGQIPSTIGDGYYYFGALFAPFFSFSFSYLAIKFNALALNYNSYWKYIAFMLAAVLFSLGLGMYNEVITIQYFWSWVISILLVSKYL
ncbi:hypothetical protein [uncultured Bacteroides sp.]|uniref:hypothetical protein n=1 Tax=uncultured Bacteroides sp. TaxID=162156 RepID=UPI0025D29284|nr:hypothetical protein [uncultured Bacteroides sp.]